MSNSVNFYLISWKPWWKYYTIIENHNFSNSQKSTKMFNIILVHLNKKIMSLLLKILSFSVNTLLESNIIRNRRIFHFIVDSILWYIVAQKLNFLICGFMYARTWQCYLAIYLLIHRTIRESPTCRMTGTFNCVMEKLFIF